MGVMSAKRAMVRDIGSIVLTDGLSDGRCPILFLFAMRRARRSGGRGACCAAALVFLFLRIAFPAGGGSGKTTVRVGSKGGRSLLLGAG